MYYINPCIICIYICNVDVSIYINQQIKPCHAWLPKGFAWNTKITGSCPKLCPKPSGKSQWICAIFRHKTGISMNKNTTPHMKWGKSYLEHSRAIEVQDIDMDRHVGVDHLGYFLVYFPLHEWWILQPCSIENTAGWFYKINPWKTNSGWLNIEHFSGLVRTSLDDFLHFSGYFFLIFRPQLSAQHRSRSKGRP